MITFWILLSGWVFFVLLNAFYHDHISKENEEKRKWDTCNNIRTEALSYKYWLDSLDKTGYPKHPSGGYMNAWELYEYWNSGRIDKRVLYNHVNRNLEEYEKEKEKIAKKIIYENNTVTRQAESI